MTMSCVRVMACSGILFAVAVVTGHAQAPSPPSGLSPQVSGNFVQVSWNASPGAVSYVLQAGTAPSASDLFNGAIGNITGASGTLPEGTYFWRVIAIGPDGSASAPSAESQFTVGGGGGDGGCVAPGAPQNFTFSVSGLLVTLRWSPPGSGGPPTAYVIEAGSGPGQANLFVGPTAVQPTELSVGAPPGQYFVRLRAQNACGISGVSNEQTIVVGGDTPTTPGQCAYAVSPSSVNVPIAGGAIQVNVTAPGGCRWQLQSDAFITPTSNTGTGSATVQYSVAATSTSRNGQIVLSGLDPGTVTASQVIVQQQATPGSCAVSLNPSSQNVNPGGGQFQFRVTANPGCPWSVTPAGGFISIVSAGLQSGSDNVIYLVTPNSAVAARAGQIRVTSSVGSQDHAITQQGVGTLTARFVMREGSQEVTTCQVNEGGACTLDGSASTPAAQIISYTWRTVRGGTQVDSYSGANPTMVLPCTVGGNSAETFEVTLTVTNTVGQTASVTRLLALTRAGCGT